MNEKDCKPRELCGGVHIAEVKEKIVTDGVSALIEKLGYANAARFIALLGGQGDMTKEIRARREKESLEEIVLRIRKKKTGVF